MNGFVPAACRPLPLDTETKGVKEDRMNVASLDFLGFSLVVAIVYNLGRPLAWRQAVMTVANLAFLATFSMKLLSWLPFAAFIVLGYISYLLIRNRINGAFLPFLCAVLVSFFWLKKYTFLPSQSFLTFPYVTLGLSYILFRILHLLIDTHEQVIDDFVGPVAFLNYTLNFTAVISGPIQRYQDYAASQLAAERPGLDIIDAGQAMERIVFGYFKISVMGFVLQTLQNHFLNGLSATAASPLAARVFSGALIGASYPLYLYFNFSGYTDIVIGVARCIRLSLPENFDRPFSSTNFLEFWGRWHITLSFWLKTYVYSPLLKALMNRFRDPGLAAYLGVFSYFVTFFLIGVWHGRTSVFVVFGLLQGLGVSGNKLYQILMTKRLGKKGYKSLSTQEWYKALSRGFTFTFFAFSLVWFWSNWQQMGIIVRSLGAGAIVLGWLLVLALATLLLSAWQRLRVLALSVQRDRQPLILSRYTRVVWNTALVVVLIVVLKVLSVPAPDVVYRAF
jgi:alginate O-acetyltransferase complex protein AlgI